MRDVVPTLEGGAGFSILFRKASSGDALAIRFGALTPPEWKEELGLWFIQATAKAGDSLVGHFILAIDRLEPGRRTCSRADEPKQVVMATMADGGAGWQGQHPDASWSMNPGGWCQIDLHSVGDRDLEGEFQGKLVSNSGQSYFTIDEGFAYVRPGPGQTRATEGGSAESIPAEASTSTGGSPADTLFTAYLTEVTTIRIERLTPQDIAPVVSALAGRKDFRELSSSSNLVIESTRFVASTNAFWNDEVLQSSALQERVARMPGVPAKAVQAWTEALGRFDSAKVDPIQALGLIVAQDRLFAGARYDDQEADRMLRRIKTIPPALVRKWAEEHKLERHQAAVSIALVEVLFEDDRFVGGGG